MKWNLPSAAMQKAHLRSFDHASPLGFPIGTPGSDFAIATPSSTENAPSPTTSLVEKKRGIERAHLFVQGNHDKLLASMEGNERM